jgi:MFS family permease
MFLKLKRQINGFHIMSYYLMTFTILVIIQFINQFLTFILKSPEYYHVDPSEVGKTAGDCGFYAELFVIAFDMVLGVLFDTVGRKIPTVIGFMLVGLSIAATPWFKEVFPWFYLMRVFMSLGIIPGVNTPLLPDYVQDKSLGLANAYVSSN